MKFFTNIKIMRHMDKIINFRTFSYICFSPNQAVTYACIIAYILAHLKDTIANLTDGAANQMF